MDIWFRRLNAGDIPAVRDMTKDVWDGDDYIPDVIERWLQHHEFYTFGAFANEEKTELVGMGQVRWLRPGVAWVEGGRVHPRVQKQGIGMELARHAIDHAREHGAEKILYDTSTRNQGSQAIARHFGFKEIDRLRISVLMAGEIKDVAAFNENTGEPCKKIDAVQPRDAYPFLKSIGFEPGRFVCTGWAFVPFDRDHVDHLPWTWFKLGMTIALVITTMAGALYEGPRKNDIWYVIYGTGDEAKELLRQLVVLGKGNTTIESYSVFCPETLVPAVEQLGFHPWEANPVWATLLGLNLQKRE